MTEDAANKLISELRDLKEMYDGIMDTLNRREKLVERLEHLKIAALRERTEGWPPIQPHPIPIPVINC